MSAAPAWIAVDWGTTRLRAWAMAPSGAVLGTADSDAGMGRLDRAGFEPALLALVGGWLGTGPADVIACGMVGSRQGWVEAPYRAVPCAPLAPPLVPAPAADPRLRVRVVPGLRQDRPADVMRGEETQIAGFLATRPGFDGILCLPGTHTKWAHISAGEVVSFQSFLTGELFDLLAHRSVLRHTVAEGWDEAAFAEGVAETLSRPERLAARLFGLRAAGLLGQEGGDAARARLSGLLIGAELAAAKPYWLGQRVALIGAPEVMDAYSAALTGLSVPVTSHDASDMTLAGLSAARAHLPEGQRPCVN
jgi:2-dehydro-3-deoxygalactonokinase